MKRLTYTRPRTKELSVFNKTMLWKLPPKIKIYEALGCIGDGRIEVVRNEAKIYSSSRGKYYTVLYDPESKLIMANDNGSYWQEYLGYPAIALLIVKGMIDYNSAYTKSLTDIPWKDINQKFKNDFVKTEQYVLEKVQERGIEPENVKNEVERIYQQIKKLKLSLLGKKIKPPPGY